MQDSKKVLIVGGDTRGTFAQKLADAIDANVERPRSLQHLEDQLSKRSPITYEVKRVGANRNLPCPCGSGRKFKKCCFNNIDPVTIEP